MKRTATIVAVIAAAAIAVFAYSGKIGGQADATNEDPAHPSRRLPTKTERPDDDRSPDRFSSLPSAMRELALELEKSVIMWRRSRSKHESFYRIRNDWMKYATAQISPLTTAQIRQLGEFLLAPDRPFSPELHAYRHAVIMIWASREPEEARERLMEIAERSDFLTTEDDDKSTPRSKILDQDFHYARVGHAMKDPKAAWEAFLKDDADPRIKRLVNESISIPGIFREYAIQLPDEAWSLALTTNHKSYSDLMVEGFADGVPAGHKWEALGQEYADALTARGLEITCEPFLAIGERWAMEDPIAALEWYTRTAPPDALSSADNRINAADDPFSDAPLVNPTQASTLLQADLLVGLYDSRKDRSREAIVAFHQLNQHGDGQPVVAALRKLVGTELLPDKIPLLDVIPGIPSPGDRNALFLQAVHAFPKWTDDPFSLDIPEAPNASLAAMRDLASRLDLPHEIRAEAEAAFQKVEAEVRELLEEEKQRRRSGSDPFSSC